MDAFILDHLVAWLKSLTLKLSEIKNTGREAIVVAISRKMPRMFEWLSQQSGDELKKVIQPLSPDPESQISLKNFVDDLHITTEYALPFLFKDKNPESYEVLVVDDIIIHGSTLRQVSSDIYALTAKLPVASAIFRCSDVGTFPYADTSLIDDMIPLSRIEETRANQFISEAIMSSSLPMDMVYPIFYLSKYETEDIVSHIKSEFKATIKTYKLPGKGRNYSESILFTGGIDQAYNNDFVKCRVFNREDEETAMVCYAPNVIAEDVVMSKSFFKNDKYEELWEEVFSSVEHVEPESLKNRINNVMTLFAAERRIKDRRCISLVAFANYLCSLSTFNYILSQSFSHSTCDVELSVKAKDLELLLGRKVAGDVNNKINAILVNRLISPFDTEKIVVETTLCPDEYKDNYILHKDIIALQSKELNKALEGIFQLQRDPARIGLFLSPSISPEEAGIAESFPSLLDVLSNFKSVVEDLQVEINKYIDTNIDCGQVSSFYAKTKTPANVTYIKRYFRAGSNSVI